jgi:GT2 family glycosyltransferase
MTHSDPPTRVAICVASYRRPGSLFALLGSLEGLTFEADAPEIRVVVIDNDASGSAREVCEDARRWLRHPLTYAIEKRRGIPQARNAALARVLGEVDWIAFVDDDEIPHPRWLETLLRVQRESDADVVTGPALPRFAEPPPSWVVEGAFFEPLRRVTGASCPTAFTNNALVRESALAGLGALFDERLTLGVGEDSELFERLAEQGARIVWADEAVVFDQIPPERVRVGWIVRRGLRTGTARTHIDLAHGARRHRSILAHGVWCIAKGLSTSLARAHRGRAARVAGLQLAASGIGRLIGLTGLR